MRVLNGECDIYSTLKTLSSYFCKVPYPSLAIYHMIRFQDGKYSDMAKIRISLRTSKIAIPSPPPQHAASKNRHLIIDNDQGR